MENIEDKKTEKTPQGIELDFNFIGQEHPIGTLIYCDIEPHVGTHRINEEHIGWFFRDCPRVIEN